MTRLTSMKKNNQKSKVKLTMIFHRTGFCWAKKVLDIIGAYKDRDAKKQRFKPNSSENEEKNRYPADLKIKHMKVAENREQDGQTMWKFTPVML